MHSEATTTHEHHHDADATDVFGFWLYIMTDCILFSCLFATFLVLNYPGAPGPDLKNYIKLSDILIETFFLLTSNFTFCLAILNLYQQKLFHVQAWLIISFLLGASFIFMEVTEFAHLASEGFRWDLSGKASSFFTLVGTHGLHVSCGLLWILVMIIQLPLLKNVYTAKRRMTYLGLFWNFLDIVWIFVFTIVYLTGAMQMQHHKADQPDYGTGKKKLGIYMIGLIICSILTLIAFGTVMTNSFSKWETFTIIYCAACIQFLVQVLFFLRLNTQTEQGKINVMSLIFTAIILGTIVVGSLWIMWNVNYNMM